MRKKKDNKEDKPKGHRRTRSTETDSDRETRLNLAKRCKQKADILKGNVPQAQDDSTSCNSEDITSKIDDIEKEDFKVIAVDVQKWVREQLEKENMLPGISNAELRGRICDRLEYITAYSDIRKEHIDKVIFVSDAEQNSTTDEDQSVGSAESEEYGIKGNINSNAEKEQRDSDGSEDWDEEKDIMAFIDEDDLEFLENLNHVNRLKIFDAVNKLPQFPGYQPKSSMETLSEIVVKSVGLMQILNNKKKLPEKEVEQFEDLLTDIRISVKHEEWIQKSQKCFARVPQSPKDAVKHDV